MHITGVEVRVVIITKNQRLDLPGKRKIFRFHIRRSYLFSPLSDGIGPGLEIRTATHTHISMTCTYDFICHSLSPH